MKLAIQRRDFLIWMGAVAGTRLCPALGAGAEGVTPQPYFAGVTRALEALAKLGTPIATADAAQIAALSRQNDGAAIDEAEKILDRYTLARVALDAEGFGRSVVGGAERTLIEQGWRVFLVRVSNPGQSTESFDVASEGMLADGKSPKPDKDGDELKIPDIESNWVKAQMQAGQTLSGFAVEYCVIELFSRDRGKRRAKLGFGAGNPRWWGPWDRAFFSGFMFKSDIFDFVSRPSHDIDLGILDDDGIACMASLTIKDEQSHIYPLQAMRIAPDMAFHPHIYRADGETVRLPNGDYSVESWRGPEYLRGTSKVTIADQNRRIDVRLRRWIDPAKWGWFSGDTHIHAAGCAHYTSPTEGVSPETMIRLVRGEGLSIGEVLNWEPGWDYQKQFFSGHAESPPAILEYPAYQSANNTSLKTNPTPKDDQSLLRYDLEISGFPSSMAGHLVLPRLKQRDYPGTKSPEDWPSWNLPILKWAKAQGGVVGFGHCGWGMQTDSSTLPNYEIPLFNSVGANEAVVDITHDACDFLSGCDSGPAVGELNLWYHLLNCGFRLAMLGETDYPCLFDERPGVGRSYVWLDRRPAGNAGYEAWIRGIKIGRLYFGDGRSHFLKFEVNGELLGGDDIALERAAIVTVKALVAARLEPRPASDQPTFREAWHIERALIDETRTVPVELVVNGQAVERVVLLADGTPRPIRFKTRIERSSWVALRIMPSGHTHPVFVTVAEKPIRTSQRSAQWLRVCVDALWNEKHRLMRESERSAAADAYDHARRTYDEIIAGNDMA